MTFLASTLFFESPSYLPGGPGDLLRDPIRFDTSNPLGNERKCVSCIQRLLESSGFDTLVVWRSQDLPNLITRIQGLG